MQLKMDLLHGAHILTLWLALNIALFLPQPSSRRQGVADAA